MEPRFSVATPVRLERLEPSEAVERFEPNEVMERLERV